METQAQVDELKGIMVRNIGMFQWHSFIHMNTNNSGLLDWSQIIVERLKQHFFVSGSQPF